MTESFDKLLDMLQDISENLPRFDQYTRLFTQKDTFKTSVSLLYSDIATFLAKIVFFLCKKGKMLV